MRFCGEENDEIGLTGSPSVNSDAIGYLVESHMLSICLLGKGIEESMTNQWSRSGLALKEN